MDQQGSTPELNQGDQTDLSPNDSSADIVDESQPSQSTETPEFFGTDEDEAEGDAPSQTTQTDDDTTQESDDSTSSVDPELAKWASSQNISLETPTEVALAKRLRDTQKAYHEKTQSAKAFEEASGDTQTEGSVETEVASIKAKLARAEFFEAHPDARELEGAMYDFAVSVKESGDEAGFNYYRTPQGWQALYKIVKAEQAADTSNDSYETGRKDERTNLAKKQQAAAPAASAVNSGPTDNKITDEKIGNMTTAEYAKFRAENPDWNPFQF